MGNLLVMPDAFIKEIESLTGGIKNIAYFCIVFDFRNRTPVRFNVEYYKDDGTVVRCLLEKLQDGSVKNVQV